jgi:hypothetical protein
LRIEQGVGQRGLIPEVWRVAQQWHQRVIRQQPPEAGGEVPDLRCRGPHAKLAAVRLKQIDTGAGVGRVGHPMHCTTRSEHVAQRLQSRIGVGQVAQHAGADNVLETVTQLRCALYRKLVNLEIVEAVLVLSASVLSMLVVLTSIPARVRPAQSVLGRLGGATAGDQHAAVIAVGLVGPEEVGIGAPPPVIPAPPVAVRLSTGGG